MLTKTINIRIHNVTHEVEEYPYVIFKEKTKLRRGTKIKSTYTTGKEDLQRTKDRILEKVETELLKNDGYTWKTLYNDEKRRTELDEGKVLPISKEDEEYIRNYLVDYLPWKLQGTLARTRKKIGDGHTKVEEGGTKGLTEMFYADSWILKIDKILDIGKWKQMTKTVLMGGKKVPTRVYYDVLTYVDLSITIKNITNLPSDMFERAIEITTSGMHTLPGRLAWIEQI